MTTYLEILNKARQRQGSLPISLLSIGDNSGDSLQGIAAVRNAVSIFHQNSFSLDATEKVADILTTVGSSLLSEPPETWDTNVIKAIKYIRGTDLVPLRLVSLEEAETLKLQTFATNEPQYWYVNEMKVYVLPVSTTSYTVKVFYQAIFPDITASTITATVMLPLSALITLEDGVYAELRNNLGDPMALQYKADYERKVGIFYQRNMHTYKRKGFKQLNLKPRRRDRSL